MIKTIAALTISMLVPAAVLAEAPATQPTTQPTTQPAAAATDAKVLIVPFVPVESTDPDWIGRAVQQSLLADLSRSSTGTSVQPFADSAKIGSVAEAVDAGKRADVRYVIFGSYQRIEPNLRITGQIVDVGSGKVVAGLKSTGSERDLFDMQDNLAFQAKWGLGTERLAEKTAAKAEAQAAQPPAQQPAIQPQGPVVMAGGRYVDSDLSKAVADGRSLIERDDAAGQSFRNSYYDDTPTYPAGYGGYYGGYPLGGYPYGWWWWGQRTIIINKTNDHCDPPRVRQPFGDGSTLTVGSRDYSRGVGNTMGSYPMTMQSTQRNYVNNQRNYIAPVQQNVARPAPANSGLTRQPFGGVRTSKVK